MLIESRGKGQRKRKYLKMFGVFVDLIIGTIRFAVVELTLWSW